MNHPERIAFAIGSTVPVLFQSSHSIQSIQSKVSQTPQEADVVFQLQTSLKAVFTAVDTNRNFTFPTSAVVFISDTTVPWNLDGAQEYADRLKKLDVRITLIAMGNKVTTSVLTNITSNIINWTDLTQPQPDNWGNAFGQALGCSGEVSTVGTTIAPSTTKRPPITVHTTVTVQPGSTTGTRSEC